MCPTMQPGVCPRAGHVGFVADKVALGQVSSEYFSFSFHLLIHILLMSYQQYIISILTPLDTRKKNLYFGPHEGT
jgi:hypothetical protein